ncbi:MAG: VOC family protein [bacterium]
MVKEPWDAFWGQRYCVVKDPGGNMIDLYAYLK